MHRSTLALILLLLAQPVFAEEVPEGVSEFWLPRLFGDHMVLQQGVRAPVWGRALPGSEVLVQIDDQEHKAVADPLGRWAVRLDPLEPGEPRSLQVRQGEMTIEVKDILVGEVWVCSGQSNMEWPVKRSLNAQKELKRSNHPLVRLAEAGRETAGEPREQMELTWRPASSDSVRNFSAVCFFFGRQLHKELKVPVGLIDTTWGGTPIEAWTPLEGFEQFSSLKRIVRRIKKANEAFRTEAGKALPEFEQWVKRARRAYDAGEPLPPVPHWPDHALDGNRRPTGLYNGMVHWLVPFAMRGVLWYQGEKNVFDRDKAAYADKMRALVSGWRKIWGQGNFPFYYVQIAPYLYPRVEPEAVAEIRAAQAAAMDIPNAGMITTTDIGEVKNIHPRNKQEVARRLLNWALWKTYGRRLASHQVRGPTYKSHRVRSNGHVAVTFARVGKGLRSRGRGKLRWFDLRTEKGTWFRAHAKVAGKDQVDVWNRRVTKPTAVRYAWHQEAVTYLENSAGLPAEQFTTEEK